RSAGDEAKRRIEHAQHPLELVAALENQPGRRDDTVGALAARQPRAFLDAVDRNFARAAENREHRAVFEKIDRVIPPFPRGDLAPVKPKDAVELAAFEGYLRGEVRRSAQCLAPSELARFSLAEAHGASRCEKGRCGMIALLPAHRKGLLTTLRPVRWHRKSRCLRVVRARSRPRFHKPVRKIHIAAQIRPRACPGNLRYGVLSGPGRQKLRIPQPPSPPGFEQTGPFVSDG